MFGFRTIKPELKQSGQPTSGTAAKFVSIFRSSFGARRATMSASRYTILLYCVCFHSSILVKVDIRSGLPMR